MEYQHTTHIVTCGDDSTQSQISNKSKLSNSLAMDTLYGALGVHLNNVHSYAIRIKMPYNILCYSRRRVRSKDGDS